MNVAVEAPALCCHHSSAQWAAWASAPLVACGFRRATGKATSEIQSMYGLDGALPPSAALRLHVVKVSRRQTYGAIDFRGDTPCALERIIHCFRCQSRSCSDWGKCRGATKWRALGRLADWTACQVETMLLCLRKAGTVGPHSMCAHGCTCRSQPPSSNRPDSSPCVSISYLLHECHPL